MGMLAHQVDHVIGVDTHRDSLTAAVTDTTGAVETQTTLLADAFGYRRLLAFAKQNAPGRRVWAIEGTGSFGSGFCTYLLEKGEWVVEIDRPARPATRNGAKSDELDAARAAREALSREHLAQPRRRGDREALRVLLATRQSAVVARTKAINLMKGILVTAPESLRNSFRNVSTDLQLSRCARLRTSATRSEEHRCTVMALRAAARRALALEAEAADLEEEIERIVTRLAPRLLQEPGSGRSAQHRSSAPGHTPDAFAQKQPSPRSPGPPPSLRLRVTPCDTDSTAEAIAN